MRLLKDPLFHFLILGTLIFAYANWRGDAPERTERIVVSTEQQARLTDLFEQTWDRAPTPEETATLIDTYIEEEIYVREATRLGLDGDDPVIRRRLVQKMELLGDAVELPDPTDAELDTFLQNNLDLYQGQPVLSFTQDPLEGTATTLPTSMSEQSLRQIAAVFGADFADQLNELSLNPDPVIINSTFGTHRVTLTMREEPKPPTLDRLRPRLLRDYRRQQRNTARTRAFEVLKETYTITTE